MEILGLAPEAVEWGVLPESLQSLNR